MNFRKPKIRLSAIERTAYHEAGHVVADYIVGFEIEYATIIPDEDSNGHVQSKEFANYYYEGFRLYHINDYQLAFNSIIVNLAGYLSERKATGKGKLLVDLGDYGSSLDLFKAFKISNNLRDAMMGTAEGYLCDIFNQERPWELVKLIAASLLERKTLTGQEITEIIENSNFHIRRKTKKPRSAVLSAENVS
ncbi:MAG: hypothetical protein WC699_02490 [Bacteroidales bacterium]|jgi:hypothetical protein